MTPRLPLAGAVVIGSEYRQLGLIRSLGRHGVPVWVLAGDHWLGRVTRYARRTFAWPRGAEADRLAFLIELSRKHHLERWALIPGEDQEAALIARHHAALSEHYVLTTPPWSVVQWAHDKRLTYRIADELGIDHPWTHRPEGRGDLETIDHRFQLIVKPAFKEDVNALTAAKAWRVDDRQELIRRYDEACELIDPALVMVQELVGGGGESQVSYAALCGSGRASGRPVASLVVRRLRQWPVDFGRSSTFVETIDLPEVEELAERLLAAIGFEGLVEIEFKRDARSGSYKLLDVNPRIWGWHSVGRAAGVDFPFLMWELLNGRSSRRVRGTPGVRWVHTVTDLPMALLEMRRRRLSPLAYLRSLRPPVEAAVFALDDPLPALVEVPMVLSLLWHRRREFASLLPSPMPRGGENVQHVVS